MAIHTTLDSLFTDIANNIRNKLGTSEIIIADNFPTAINRIVTDPSGECTATNDDILLGKTAYAGNQLRTGTIPTKTDQDITSEGGIVTIPAGYYAQQYTKQGDPTGDATMTSGNQMLLDITAYSKGVKYTGTIPTKTDADMTVSHNTVTAPTGYYATDSSKSVPISELDNSIISGTVYEEATGDYAWRSTVNIPEGYHQAQELVKDFSEIFPAPETEGTASELRFGYQLFNHLGQKITGVMTESSAAIYNTSSADQIISGSQYLTGDQTIKAVITNNIDPENIKTGVTISVGDENAAGRIIEVTGTFTSDATATAGLIREGYTAYISDGTKATGTIPDITPEFTGGTLSINSSATAATGTNITLNNTTSDPGSGIYIVTSGTATPAKADINYAELTQGYVNIESGATAIPGNVGSAAGLTENNYYITNVNIPANKLLTINMTTGATLHLVDSITNKTWVIQTDSVNNALTIVQ